MIKEGQTDDLLFFCLLVRKDQSQIKVLDGVFVSSSSAWPEVQDVQMQLQ